MAGTAAPAAAAGRTGRIVVTLREDAPPRAVAARTGVTRAAPAIPRLRAIVVRPAGGAGLRAALARLRADPRVLRAEPESRFELRYEPDDPALAAAEPDAGAAAGTTLQWYVRRHGFPRAWEHARGRGATVAVIDTGVDGGHPDLAGKVDRALDFDDDSSAPATEDADGHGTHVASLACAGTDNDIGIAGAGFDCRLIVIRSDLTDSSVARGIVAAADAGAHALNMSFGDDGGTHSQIVEDAIAYAVARDVVLVAAAADEPVEEQGEPANLLQPTGTGPDIAAGRGLSVTAAQMDDRRATFAGRGSQISLAAYGALRSTPTGARGLFALYPRATTPRERPTLVPPSVGCDCRATLDGESHYAFLPGTSMAAPQVAAAAALVGRLNPDLSGLEVVRILKRAARRPAGTGWDPELGWGILDAGAAVGAARRVDRRPPTSRATARRRGRTLVVRWRGRDPAPAPLVASGIRRYELHRSVGGRPYRRIASTRRRSLRQRLRPGRAYAYATAAVDRAGNREPLPARPDVRVRGR